MRVDFSSFKAMQDSVRPHLDNVKMSEGEIESLKSVLDKDGVTIHSVNESDLDPTQKAVAVLIMMLRDTPADTRYARVSGNLGQFFDKVVAGKEQTFRKLLRVDGHGTDPFTDWGPLQIRGATPDSFTIADGRHAVVQLKGSGMESQPKAWSPDAIEKALDQVRTASAHGSDPLMSFLKTKLDQLEGGVLDKAAATLQAELQSKRASIAQGATELSEAAKTTKAPPNQVPQANIDAVGVALARAQETYKVGVNAEVYGKDFNELKSRLVSYLAKLSDNDTGAVAEAAKLLDAAGNPALSGETARQAGVNPRAFSLLLLFRAFEQSLGDVEVQAALRNGGPLAQSAASLLAANNATLIRNLEGLRVAAVNADPLGFDEGAALIIGNRRAGSDFMINEVAIGVNGAAVGHYNVTTNLGLVAINESQIYSNNAWVPFDKLSINALRLLAEKLMPHSPSAVLGAMRYFRQAEEQTRGGASYNTMLDNLCAELSRKAAAKVDAMAAATKALEPLQAVENQAPSAGSQS